MSLRNYVVLALAALAAAVDASAAEYVVSPTGNDGSTSGPWRTLQKAIGSVRAGDTVTVEDGEYGGFACDGVSGTPSARIVLRARNKWGAKITSAGVGADANDFIQLFACSYVTVDGFQVSGSPRSGIAILGNRSDGSDARGVIIQNCYSHHNGGTSSAGRHDGIFSGFALDLTIQDNLIHDTGEHGIYVSNAADNPIIRRNVVHDTGVNCVQINADLSTGGDGLISNWLIEENVLSACRGSAGINLDGAIQGIARNNLVYGCLKGGLTLFQGDGAAASHDNLVVNNTIYCPNGSRAALQVADGANNNVIFNNILYAAGGGGLEIQSVSGLVHDYNLVSSYEGGSASVHESSPAAGSIFANIGSNDYTLAASSPALDTGVASLSSKNAPATDLTGAARPAGTGFDRGCYERGAVGLDGGSAQSDAAAPGTDAGSIRPDAAAPRADAAVGRTDGGKPRADAGQSGLDAGGDPVGNGCGCASSGGWEVILALAACGWVPLTRFRRPRSDA